MSLLNPAIAGVLSLIPEPLVGHLAKKYIAGETVEDATRLIAELNEQGFSCTVNILGEHITTIEAAGKYFDLYKTILLSISELKLDSNLSIKMTQMGMGIDDEVCIEFMNEIIQLAKEENNFIRIDMEDSTYTTKTLTIHSNF